MGLIFTLKYVYGILDYIIRNMIIYKQQSESLPFQQLQLSILKTTKNKVRNDKIMSNKIKKCKNTTKKF